MIENVIVLKQELGDTGRYNYVMFFEFEGLRFSQVWGIEEGTGLDEKQVAREFIDAARAEVEIDPDRYRNIGTPVSDPLPELRGEWETLNLS